MKITAPSRLVRFLALGVFAALPLLLALPLRAQTTSAYAGTYIGTLNTKVTAGPYSIENSFGGYIAVVSSSGAIDLSSGSLTGTVSSSGAVTFTGGSQFASLGITSATIANNQLSSGYGAVLANGTSQYKINASTSFTPAAGTGGGGNNGGGNNGGGSTAGNDLLAYYSFNDSSNLYKDDSGRNVTLAPVGGTISAVTAGKFGGSMRTNGVRLRALVNSTFSTSTYTLSFFMKAEAAGNWNPRLVAVQVPGTSTHYYGSYINGASTSARAIASYHKTGNTARIYLSGNTTVSTGTGVDWTHVAITNDGSTVKMYLNGTEVVSQANAGAPDTFSTAMLMLGGSDNGLDLFVGQLDEVRLYNRALTTTELATLRAGTAVGSAVSGNGSSGVVTADVIAAPANLTGYRSRVNQSFQFSVTGATVGGVWGTDVYTDDSSLARAAVHAGVVAPGETKTITVTVLPGQSSYPASTRNGVTSYSWGSWTGSYSFAGSTGATYTGSTVPAPSVATSFTAASLTIPIGGRLVLPISITGTGPFTYQWYLNGLAITNSNVNPYVVETLTSGAAGTYTVKVTNPGGSQTFTAGTVAVNAVNSPVFTLEPFDKVVAPGGTFALATSAVGSNLSYQWYRNGVALSGETQSIILRQNVNSNDAGSYTVRVSNSAGSITSKAGVVTLNSQASVLRNLSIRSNISSSQPSVTAGFVIRGTGTKRVLIRATGPALIPFGISSHDALANPKLEVFAGSTLLAQNDNWGGSSQVTAVGAAVGAFALTNASSTDAAVVLDLPATAGGANYSAKVTSADGSTGVTLLEVYDADSAPTSKLVNVSALCITSSGVNNLILGFVIIGQGQRTILARGTGPTLAQFGVGGTLVDPKLNVFDSNNRIVISNNDWNGADFVSELVQATDFVGAFGLGAGTTDASTLALLSPGAYSIQIIGNDDGSGQTLAEIYEVP